MLALDDPHWKLLNHAYGAAGDVPEILADLKKNYDRERADALFYGSLCHQYTVYAATFAAVPHVLEIASQENSLPETKANVVIFAGAVHAFRDYDNRARINSTDEALKAQLDEKIQFAYRAAIEKTKRLAENLLENSENLDEENKNALFFPLLAFYGQENLSRIFFFFPSLDEFVFDCPHCANEIYLQPENERLVAYKEDTIFNRAAEKSEITPALIDPQTWNGEFSEAEREKWILAAAEKYSLEALKYQIPFLFGRMICPHCRQSVKIIEALTK